MNRREAIAALTALPAVTRITRADVKPSDVIVVECDRPISHQTADRIKAHMQQVWPGNQVVVVGDGMRLKVMEGGKV